MILKKLIRAMSRFAPLSLQDDWDFSGYQIGERDFDREIRRILLCLDFTETVFDEAVTFEPDLILTHHPFFFGDEDEILRTDEKKALLSDRIEHELHAPIYSYHTCFDKSDHGMNRTLLEILGLEDIHPIADSYLWIGSLPEKLSFDELVRLIRSRFGFGYLIGMKNDDDPIEKIGFVAGGGSSEFMVAIKNDVDCFISSDCPHHARLDMRRYGLNYIEEPHEVEELGFLSGMGKLLRSIDDTLVIDEFSFERPFSLIGERE